MVYAVYNSLHTRVSLRRVYSPNKMTSDGPGLLFLSLSLLTSCQVVSNRNRPCRAVREWSWQMKRLCLGRLLTLKLGAGHLTRLSLLIAQLAHLFDKRRSVARRESQHRQIDNFYPRGRGQNASLVFRLIPLGSCSSLVSSRYSLSFRRMQTKDRIRCQVLRQLY